MRRLGPFLSRILGAKTTIGLVSVVGLTLGYWLVPRADPVDPPELEAPGLRLYGTQLPKGPDAETRALEYLRDRVRGSFSLALPDGTLKPFSYGDLGVRIDKARLRQLVRDVHDPTSPLRRTRRRLNLSAAVELPAPLDLDETTTIALLQLLKDSLDRSPQDARLDLSAGTVLSEQVGWLVDMDQSLANLRSALTGGAESAQLAVRVIQPSRTKAQLSTVAHDTVLGRFETSYDRADKAAARTYNLKLAASRLDGYVLPPGEVFDFNQVVGPRDEVNGYKVAPVIAAGEVVDGIGGGTCQISGTLHGAAFFAGLEIEERHPHTRPSTYIKMGLDATVVYPTINFRLRNPHTFPVVIHQTVEGGTVRAEILGSGAVPTTSLIRRVIESKPYEQIERPEPGLPEGKRALLQRGVPGFKIRRYRIVRNGEHAVREGWTEFYPPTTQVIGVGTGAKDARVTVVGDTHPEYVADELLVMTSYGKEAGEPDFRMRRKPGRFGRQGWTAESGMPVFEVP